MATLPRDSESVYYRKDLTQALITRERYYSF